MMYKKVWTGQEDFPAAKSKPPVQGWGGKCFRSPCVTPEHDEEERVARVRGVGVVLNEVDDWSTGEGKCWLGALAA